MKVGADAEWERLDLRRVPPPGDRELLPVGLRFEEPGDGLQEVVAVELYVKPDDVRTEHPVEDLLWPWTDAVRFRVRPRDMPENGHLRVGTLLLDQRREQGEVVVLDQDKGRLFPGDLRKEGVGELFVHHPVMGPVLQAEFGTDVGDVAERPTPLVREPVIVAGLFLLGQPY